MNATFSFHVPTQIRFGWRVSDEVVSALPEGTNRVALLRGVKGVAAERVRNILEASAVSSVDVICSGEPSVASVNAIVDRLEKESVQAVIALGGGAVIDAGKVAAFCLGHHVTLGADFGDTPASLLAQTGPVPCIAIPTTAGTGAEVTGNAVLEVPEQRAKVSLRGRALFPAMALVDPELLKSAPTLVLLSSGLDAVVQTIEAYTSCAATPFSDALTAPNIPLGLKALNRIVAGDPTDKSWETLAWVSLTSGVALANGGLGAAHGLASVIGGRYGAPHGALCGRLLAPVLRKNAEIADDGTVAANRLRDCAAHIFDVFPEGDEHDQLSGFEDWQARQNLPRLRDFNVTRDDIPSIAEAAVVASSSKKNVVPLTPHDFRDILIDAL